MLENKKVYIPKYINIFMENNKKPLVKTGDENPVNRTSIKLDNLDMSRLLCAILESANSNHRNGYFGCEAADRVLYAKLKKQQEHAEETN